jgi:(S)-mandelate dehydrogenase
VKVAVNIADLERQARSRLPKVVYDYLAGGAEDERTLKENREAFGRWHLRTRVLRGHGAPDLSTTLFGQKMGLPILIGPTGLNGLHWRGADVALARAAASLDAVFALSTASNESLEAVAKSTPGPKWYQLYPWGDRSVCQRLIERAKSAGYGALVVTVDSLIGGKRERDLRNNFSHELRVSPRLVVDGLLHPHWLLHTWLRGGGMPRFENVAEFVGAGATAADLAEFTRSQRNTGLTWDDIAWMKSQWGDGPVLVKGIGCVEDVEPARRAGVDGLVVSNHGGRQVDGVPGTLDLLPEIVSAAGPEMPVLLDGGIRRGSDVIKALALGARAVLVGRATLFGVAASGQEGATLALTILRDELRRTLAMVGVPSVATISRDVLRPAPLG